MAEQLQMIWPENRRLPRPEGQVPPGYLPRTFHRGDEEAYVGLMRLAGFADWNGDGLIAVLENAVPMGIVFMEHEASSKIVATAMGWLRPSSLFPEAYEMGWVAADPAVREWAVDLKTRITSLMEDG